MLNFATILGTFGGVLGGDFAFGGVRGNLGICSGVRSGGKIAMRINNNNIDEVHDQKM